jgi:hypothetical protein
MEQSVHKKYVKVKADFTVEGEIIPCSIEDEEGNIYEIQRITDIRRAACLRAGGRGLRFTCVVDGYEKKIYYEENNKWFVEV